MNAGTSRKTQIRCPHCDKLLGVGERFFGRNVNCPACGGAIAVPEQRPTVVRGGPPQPPIVSPLPSQQPPMPPPQAPPLPPPLAPETAPSQEPAFPQIAGVESLSQRARGWEAAEEGGGGGVFAPEKRGLQAGVLGGLLMMAIAVVWFVGGLAAGILFYYPPILFIIGIVGLFKGIATGNVAGRRRRY